MITEDYVSFETAKLLKEKGFDEPTLWFYVGDGTKYLAHKTLNGDWYRRPTLQMAMKWLREVHYVFIYITPSLRYWGSNHKYDKEHPWFLEGYRPHVFHGDNPYEFKVIDKQYVPTYEEACEAAIKYCLKNLILDMDYEKKYKELQSLAKSYQGNSLKEFLDLAFPELKESEDEKIRQTLIDMVKRETGFTGFPSQGQVLAYLEKQKEQKPVEKISVSEELYEHIRNACACIDDAMSSDMMSDIADYLTMANSSAQKALDMVDRSFVKQPAERSEEDEKIRKWILDGLDFYADAIGAPEDHKKAVTYLERQKEQQPTKMEVYRIGKGTASIKSPSDKEIVDALLHQLSEQDGILTAIDGVSIKTIISYLERQKEQKPAKLNDDTEVGLDRALQIVKDARENLPSYQTDDGIYECDHAIQTLERILKNGIEQQFVECSEDERIRKALVNFFKNTHDWVNLKYDGNEIVAYLERQKGKMTAEEYEKSELFQLKLKTKYADGFQDALAQNPQPAEWSEEDKRLLRTTLECLDYVSCQSKTSAVDWLKSLPERFNLQPKQEWSEEDEIMLRKCISATFDHGYLKESDWLKSHLYLRPKQERQIREGDKVSIHCRKGRKEDMTIIYDGKVGEVIHVWDAKRNPWGHIVVRLNNGCNDGFYEDELEILDEHSWKPSEEQMDDLNFIITALRKDYCDGMADFLASLYHDLQKLL